MVFILVCGSWPTGWRHAKGGIATWHKVVFKDRSVLVEQSSRLGYKAMTSDVRVIGMNKHDVELCLSSAEAT